MLLPQNLEEFIDFSMIAQAEGLKFGIEHFRRRKPHCSGTLLWQFNDCWPVQSWSIVDYYGFGKAGYYYVKRVYAQVLASFRHTEQGNAELWITNDKLQSLDEEITIQHGTFAEGHLWEEQLQIQVPSNCSRLVWQADAKRLNARPDHYLRVHATTDCFPPNRLFFAAIKDLKRPVEAPEISVTSHGKHELRVEVQATVYLYYFHLSVPDEHTQFSDNYFDLAPGDRATVIVRNDKIELQPQMVSSGWR